MDELRDRAREWLAVKWPELRQIDLPVGEFEELLAAFASSLQAKARQQLRAAKEAGYLGHKWECKSQACKHCNAGSPIADSKSGESWHRIGVNAYEACLKKPCSCGFAEKWGDLL